MDTTSIVIIATFSVSFLLALFIVLWVMLHRIFLSVDGNNETCKQMQVDVQNMTRHVKELDDKINKIQQQTQLTYNHIWQGNTQKQPELTFQQMNALFSNLSSSSDTSEADSSISMAETDLMSHMKNLRSEIQS